MYVLPAIVTDPLREADPVFWAIDMSIVAGPVPLEPPTTEIHETEDEAVHAQSAVVNRFTDTLVGAEPTDTPLLESVDEQELPA